MHASTQKARMLQPRLSRRDEGFTLIEILIVIGIVMLLMAIVLGSITRLGANNRRMTCQSNLSQIYQACRLYQQDEGGFPFYDAGGLVSPSQPKNIGLWALYTFPKPNMEDPDPDAPVGRYIRSPRMLHCPQDNATGEMSLMLPSNAFNLDYLSYQRSDGATQTYQSIRDTTPGTGADYEQWKRQLVTFNGSTRVYRAPADDTVVTWCSFHRQAMGGRDFDNVLFYDGSVQLIPRLQDVSTGWERTPKSPQ